MAERIVSPGVFTQERDQSFLAQGVAEIGAAFVGPTPDGPAFIPTVVQGIDGFTTTFGEPDDKSYMGYTVRNYLQEAGSATIVRVLGLAGYTKTGATIYTTGSAGRRIIGFLHPTSGSGNVASVAVGGTTGSFSIRVSSSNAGGPHISASGLTFTPGVSTYVGNVFGSSPSNTNSPVYSYVLFPDVIAQTGNFNQGPDSASFYAETTTFNLGQYTNAKTPWIRSQTIGGTKKDLFRIHTISDGETANKKYKVIITNVQPNLDGLSDYGTFGLQVCEYNEEDNTAIVIDGGDFTNPPLTLNPNDDNYIARRIGTSAVTYNATTGDAYFEGDYPNATPLIRVEMSTNDIPALAVPFGFAPLYSTVSGSTAEMVSGSYWTSRWRSTSTGTRGWNAIDALGPDSTYYGFDFTNKNSLTLLGPVVSTNVTVGSEFSLEDSWTNTEVAGQPILLSDRENSRYRSFAVPFQGGFSGLDPSREIAMGAAIRGKNTQGFDLSNAAASGSIEYKRALRTLSNPESVDLNLLVIPGVIYSQHPYIAQYAIDLCESRGDCFYILDLNTIDESVTTVVNSYAKVIDTNYAASYYPWVRIFDDATAKSMWAPPSVVLPEVYKYSDNVGAEWFAPAGLNRGGIPGAVGVRTRLTQALRDTLYEGKVNPIAQFPGQGICVWGQKTLQRRSSALDRVNVRRLLITVKKFIASSARYLVFEQNTEATRNRFLNIVNPYLAGIQQNSGLTAFRVVMDETNNTPDIIDRNILVGSIYLQPTRTAEFIKLDFNILPTGATFDTI